MRFYVIIAGLALITATGIIAQTPAVEFEKNWPQFRGPNSNQIPNSDKLPIEWSARKNLSWTYNIPGNGWSSPIIWGNRVFVSTAIPDKSQLKSSKEHSKKPTFDVSYELHCLDLNSGELLWKRVVYKGRPYFVTHRDNTYASETPVTDGERVYVYFGALGLYCFDIEGNPVWEKTFGAYLTLGDWGTSTSPTLYDNHLYMQIDSEDSAYLVALDPATGDERWRVDRGEKTNWSTPVIWKNKIRTELVTSGQTARAYDPYSGALLWELELGGGRNISSPTSNEDYLYLGNEERTSGGGILYAVKAGATGNITVKEGASTSAGVAWSLPKSGLSMASPVLHKGFIYLVDPRGSFISCVDAVTGRHHYQRVRVTGAKAFWATPWIYDDKLFCLDDAGTTFVIQTGGHLKVLAKNSIKDKFWASAAFANNAIVLRGVDKVYCIRSDE
jgi:outer membrane protein assembly factor BamB